MDKGGARHVEVQGVKVPTLLYGTAWKEAETRRLTKAALEAGFRGIDTANQRRHYFEAAVGEAVKEALAAGRVARADLFLQTKFTFVGGQDHRLPYDFHAPVPVQVEQSLRSSLEHLGVERVDALLLHGPSTAPGLGAADVEAWGAMEQEHRAGRARLLGLSNVTPEQLQLFHERASIKPTIVQNRCFTRPKADHAVREFCKRNGILYEGFSLLTASRALLVHPVVQRAMERTGRTAPQVVFRYCLQEGMVALTGTTSREHMQDDLAVYDFELRDDEVAAIGRLFA